MDPVDAFIENRRIAPVIDRLARHVPIVQIVRFGFVGVFVTLLHVAVALSVHGVFAVPPLRANVVAFLAASATSYMLNWFWTFDAESAHGVALPRFLTVSFGGFAVNQAIVYAVVALAGKPLWVAMIPVVIVIPIVSFCLNKLWVFLPHKAA